MGPASRLLDLLIPYGMMDCRRTHGWQGAGGLALVWLLVLGHAVAVAEESAPGRFEFTQTEMATPVRIVVHASDETVARRGAAAAFSRIRALNDVFSDYDEESEVRRLCAVAAGGTAVRVSEDLWRVLTRSDEISRTSRGAFDVTVGPVVRLWRRARRLGRLPTPEQLEKSRTLVDYRLLRFDPAHRTVRLLRADLRIDLGAIAKGYAADEALRVLRAQGLPRSLVDVSGDIAVGDAPPEASGWRIALAPAGRDTRRRPSLLLSRVAVATSGDTEQFVIIDGRRYSHIVDPRTGMGLTDHSVVTVVAPDCMTADALASAVSVLGPREGLKLVDSAPGAASRLVHIREHGEEAHESASWKSLPLAPGEEPSDTTSPARKALDPTLAPPVAWLRDPVPVPEARATTEAEMRPYTERLPGRGVTFDMVPIPGGVFRMGSPPNEAKRGEDEGPVVEVEVDPFWMATCEVTWDAYELWASGYDSRLDRPSDPPPAARDRLADAITRPSAPYADMTFGMGKEGCPAVCMTQLAAKIYCKWLSAKTGRYYRLPTEAEWEYACRAGTTTAYSFGDDPRQLGDHAWYFDNSDDRYHEVGRKRPNPWGLFDLHGNVAEWVLDRHTPDGYRRLAGNRHRNPLLEPEAIYPRVVRGGSWLDDAEALRSAARTGSTPAWKRRDPQLPQSIWYHTDAAFVGFRVVRPLRVPSAEEASRYDLDPAQKKALANYLEYLKGRGGK